MHRIAAREVLAEASDALVDTREVIDLAEAMDDGVGVHAQDDLGDLVALPPARDGAGPRVL